MTALEDLPRPVYRAIVAGIVLYFAFLVVGAVTDQPALVLVAQALFGILAIGIGASLLARPEGRSPVITVAAAALVLGGVAQFLWLATADPLFERLGSALVLVGIGGYLLAILRAD